MERYTIVLSNTEDKTRRAHMEVLRDNHFKATLTAIFHLKAQRAFHGLDIGWFNRWSVMHHPKGMLPKIVAVGLAGATADQYTHLGDQPRSV